MAVVPPEVCREVLTFVTVFVVVRPRDRIWLSLRVGGVNQAWLFDRALRRGELPAEARVERWQRYVRSYFSPRVTKVRRLVMVALGVVLAALVVLASLVPVVSGSPRISTFGLVWVVAMGLAGCASLWFYERRDRRRMARLGTLLGSPSAS